MWYYFTALSTQYFCTYEKLSVSLDMSELDTMGRGDAVVKALV